jgi:hypothetical protein
MNELFCVSLIVAQFFLAYIHDEYLLLTFTQDTVYIRQKRIRAYTHRLRFWDLTKPI